MSVHDRPGFHWDGGFRRRSALQNHQGRADMAVIMGNAQANRGGVFAYINGFYTPRRRQSVLSWKDPSRSKGKWLLQKYGSAQIEHPRRFGVLRCSDAEADIAAL